ncbi:MAG: HU family DNA-binding protein [Acidimicrobiales bacterium]|jgi:DNA-binding protein HU-beta
MNRRELAKAVAVQADVDLKTVARVLDGFTDVVTGVTAKGEPISISGFVKFVKVDRPARMGRNPATGEQMMFKASKKVRVSAAKAFRDAVMTPSKAPRLVRGAFPILEDHVKKAGVASAPVKKAPVKKAPVKKAAVKKAGVASAAVQKAAVQKAAVQKAAVKKAAVKKAAVQKAAVKKAAVKKAAVKKAAVKKAPVKKAAVKKAAVKKAPAKKRVARRR